MSTIIRNGTIVNHTEIFSADILIREGKIDQIASQLPSTIHAEQEIDAEGYFVLPGGIDPHVHMHLQTPAGFSADDFYSGSCAALAGGTTTIIDFVTPKRGQPITEALEQRKKEAETSLCETLFHVSPVKFVKNTGNELLACIQQGIRSFKVYMAYKPTVGLQDDELRQVLEIVGKAGGMLAVHCEMGDEIENFRNRFFEEGKTAPLYHALSRPSNTEAEAVKKVLAMASEHNCPLYLVHISSAESLEHISHAKNGGQRVFAETCPQYLLLNEDKYSGSFRETAPFVISPPLRGNMHSESLWEALASGLIDAVGTDHCPFNMSQKEAGLNDFRKIPNGAGGVEFRLSLLYTYGVLKNKISMERFVDLVSTTPARIFGLYPRKGVVAPGSDADLVIWNPGHQSIISAATHYQNCDINIYEGMSVKGCAEHVIAGGKITVGDKGFIKT